MAMPNERNLPVPFHILGQEIRLYWLFRGFQGMAILLAFQSAGTAVLWTPRLPELGILASGLFVCTALAMFGLSFMRRIRADVQFYAGTALDLAYINLVLYCAPGAVPMAALLMVTSVAASSLFVHIRFGLLMALLCALTLIAQRYIGPAGSAGGISVHGLPPFALIYFSLALVFIALLLGRVGIKLFHTDYVARERGGEIADLSAITRQILERLPTGVLVVDAAGDIRTSNETAMQLLHLSTTHGRRALGVVAPELQRQMQAWQVDPESERSPVTLGVEARQIEPQFLHMHPGSGEVLVFLEDTSQAARRAESITLSTLGRFSASLAHEIRNPLSAIKYSSQLLRESSNLDVMDRRMLDIIQQQIQRMNGIIDSVLGLARRERAQPQAFDLARLLQDFVDEYVAGFPLDNDTLDLQLPRAALFAHADAKQVHQILMVLVSNARYYGRMPQQPAQMTLRLREQGPNLVVDVLDMGPGIPEQAQRSLFRPFFTTSGHGTGLGLYIARELARANEGDLHYLRRATGSCFRLILPPAPALPASVSASAG